MLLAGEANNKVRIMIAKKKVLISLIVLFSLCFMQTAFSANLTITSTTTTLCGYQDYDNINITSSTVNVCFYNSSDPDSGILILKASGTITISSGSTINANSRGGKGGIGGVIGPVTVSGSNGTSGEGQGAGTRGIACNGGGGGGGGAGGFAGSGGNGANGNNGGNAPSLGGAGGSGGSGYGTNNTTTPSDVSFVGSGSGGGGGGCAFGGGPGGAGGAGGNGSASIVLIAPTIRVNGALNAVGQDGTGGNHGGNGAGGGAGAGGSGGNILIYGNSVNLTSSTINANGGNGGNGGGSNNGVSGGGGGGGSGGRIKIVYNTLTNTSATVTANAGSAGSGGSTSATAGASGSIFHQPSGYTSIVVVPVYNELNTSAKIPANLLIENVSTSNGTCLLSFQSNITLFLLLGRDNTCSSFSRIQVSNTPTYPARSYYLTITNTSVITQNTYLLNSNFGIFYSFIVTDYNLNPLSNVTITTSKIIGNTYVPVETEVSDTSGSTNFFLDYTNLYQTSVTSNGYVSLLFTVQPSTISRVTYLKLRANGTSGANILNLSTVFDSITYGQTPLTIYQNGTFNTSFFISDSAGTLEYFGMRVTYRNYSNSSVIFNQSNSTSPSGGTIIATIGNQTGYYDVETWFKKASYDQYNIQNFTYYVTNSNASGFPHFNPSATDIPITVFQVVGILVMLLSMAFFMRIAGFIGAMIWGIVCLAIMTFAMGIFTWQTFALAFLVMLSVLILAGVV